MLPENLPKFDKVPAPLPLAERARLVAPVTIEPTKPTLADELHAAAELGAVVTIEVPADGPGLPNVVQEFTGSGVFARSGAQASACALLVSQQGPGGRQAVIEVTRPGLGRFGAERPTFDPTNGLDATLANGAVVDWIEQQADDIREAIQLAHLPLLVVIGSECVPDDIDAELRARLERLASDERAVVALVQDVEGYGAARWTEAA